jgi:hypothetical protein
MASQAQPVPSKLTSLIYKTSTNQLDSVSFEAVVTERYASRSVVTDHPVEKGANVADHVRSKPDTLTIDAIITDYPIANRQTTFGSSPTAAKGRASDVFNQLALLKAAGALVEVRSARRTYESMVIDGLDENKTKDTGRGAVRFTMTLRRVRFVDSQVVPIKITKLNKAKAKHDDGKQTPKPVEDKKSLFVRLVDGVSGAFKKAPVK